MHKSQIGRRWFLRLVPTFAVFSSPRLRAQSSAYQSRTVNTVYEADQDGIVIATVTLAIGGGESHIAGYTDNANPPATIRVSASIFNAETTNTRAILPLSTSLSMIVKRNDFYRVTSTSPSGTPAFTLWFIPA